MPSTIIGIVALVYIVFPGFVFQWTRAGTRPRAEETSTHGAARILVAGVIATTAAAGVVMALRFGYPGGPVDPRRLFGEPGYLYTHLLRTALTGGLIAGLSTALAYLVARLIVRRIRRHNTLVRAMDDPFGEAWWNVFHDDPARLDLPSLIEGIRRIYVEVLTTDKQTVKGYVRLVTLDYTSKDLVLMPGTLESGPNPHRRMIIPLQAIAMVNARYLEIGPKPYTPVN